MPRVCASQASLFAQLGEADPSPTGGTGRARRPEPPPRWRLSVLGSGSGGNCAVLARQREAVLLDAGFGPRTIERRLAQAGLRLSDVQAICLTHLDRDHLRESWPEAARAMGIPLHLHHWHLDTLHALPSGPELLHEGLVEPFDRDPFQPVEGLTARPMRCQHDMQGTIGYRLTTPSGSLGYVTDLGHVPESLIDLFAGVDVLCLEANYDAHMTRNSSRPAFVNRRNLSSSGHLSNTQCAEAVRRIAAASPAGRPEHVVLLHRSRECNHPTTVRRAFDHLPDLRQKLTLTDQRRRSRWIPLRKLPAVHRCQMPLPL